MGFTETAKLSSILSGDSKRDHYKTSRCQYAVSSKDAENPGREEDVSILLQQAVQDRFHRSSDMHILGALMRIGVEEGFSESQVWKHAIGFAGSQIDSVHDVGVLYDTQGKEIDRYTMF